MALSISGIKRVLGAPIHLLVTEYDGPKKYAELLFVIFVVRNRLAYHLWPNQWYIKYRTTFFEYDAIPLNKVAFLIHLFMARFGSE